MKILIVVDLQKGFITDDIKPIADNIVKISHSNYFDFIIATKFINKPHSQYVKFLNWNDFMDGEKTELIDDLNHDKVFVKGTYNAINFSMVSLLKRINRGHKPEEVYVCGVDTDACVLASAYGLFDANIRPILLTNFIATSASNKELNQASLEILKRNIGKKQLDGSKLEDFLEGKHSD